MFTWDKGKLVRFYDDIDPNSSSSSDDYRFTYDAYGRRLSKVYEYDPGPDYSGDFTTKIETNYYYDHNGRLVRETSDEDFTESASIYRELIYLYDESGMVGVLYNFNNISTKAYYYHRNLQGDVISIFDQSGVRQAEYAYDAYGNCEIVYDASGTDIANINPIRYRGYYYDRRTKLYYLNSRYYNPEWRRFISPADVSKLNPSIVNGLNLYCYSSNSPISIARSSSVVGSSGIDGMTSLPAFFTMVDNNYTAALNCLSVKFPSQNWVSLGIDFTASMTGAMSVLSWTLKNPEFYDFWHSAYGISKYEILSNLKSPLTKAASVISYGFVAYDTYTDVMGHINAGDSWQTTTASGIVTASVGTLNVLASANVGGIIGARVGSAIGGVPGFLIGTAAGVVVGIVVNGIFYTEINGKSIAGHIEDGIEWFLELIS